MTENLYSKDQKVPSGKYRDNYDRIRWGSDGKASGDDSDKGKREGERG